MAPTLNIPEPLKSQAGIQLSNLQSCAHICSHSDTSNLSLPSLLPQLVQKQGQHLHYPLAFAMANILQSIYPTLIAEWKQQSGAQQLC